MRFLGHRVCRTIERRDSISVCIIQVQPRQMSISNCCFGQTVAFYPIVERLSRLSTDSLVVLRSSSFAWIQIAAHVPEQSEAIFQIRL